MVSNEVYTGAGASATLIPEMEFDVGVGMNQTSGNLDINDSDLKTVDWALTSANVDKRLVADILTGCMAKVTVFQSNNSTVRTAEQVLMIKTNTTNSISFNQDLTSVAADRARVVIQPFGAPLFRPTSTASKEYLLSDGWLGLVNSITAPSITVDNKQMNLAVGGTRDFRYQFKGRETVGNGSLDVSVNSGVWLYYALGEMTIDGTTESAETLESAKVDEDCLYLDKTSGKNTKLRRAIKGTGNAITILPPLLATDTDSASEKVTAVVSSGVPVLSNNLTYTFTPTNGPVLPSFALELTHEKSSQTLTVGVDAKPSDNIMSKIYTGCQVNSLTLSFEEGMELKSNVDFLARRVFDAPEGYVPKTGEPDVSKLMNFNSDQGANKPFLFSDGEIRIFGQEYARVKSGTLTITNNLTPHSFIGNYNREITSAQTAGQRMYELSLNLLITDSEIWDKLRDDDEAQNQADGDLISLIFTKNTNEKITLTLDNYVVTNVDIPFPEDKGALEATMTVAPRTLKTASYVGKWAIMG